MNATTVLRTTAAARPSSDTRPASASSWVRRFFAGLETWFSGLQMREVEAYLAQAQDAADLERRINQLQHARRSQSLLMR